MTYYLISFGVMLLCALIVGSASAGVRSTFNQMKNIPTKSRMTGYDTAKKLLRAGGVTDITVGRTGGELTDHYHPSRKEVNLSESTFGDTSVASVAVAAHEIGHVMQKKTGYIPYKIRNILVPITNIGSRLAFPLVLIGLIIDLSIGFTQNSNLGYYLALIGVALYGLATVFALVTLPVELNASKRAKVMLIENGILTEEELPYASKMLSAAARTYLASVVTSLIYFLRFALWVFLLFGGNRRRD